jgi:hypothetical protein
MIMNQMKTQVQTQSQRKNDKVMGEHLTVGVFLNAISPTRSVNGGELTVVIGIKVDCRLLSPSLFLPLLSWPL